MSPSDPAASTSAFKVRAHDPAGGYHDPDAWIKVYDGHGNLRAEGEGSVSLDLPKGLYTVRVERFGEMREEVVVHRDGTDRPIEAPLRNSAMPMSDTRHTHGFLQASAERYSTRSTFEQGGANDDWPRLMIFVRSAAEEAEQVVEVRPGLTLYNAAGDVVSAFAAEETRPDRPDAFVVYSALLEPGNYILAQSLGSRLEMLPVTLHGRWDQFIFVPFQKRARLSRSSIKTVRHGRGYDPQDHEASRIDAALLGLGSRLDLLSPRDRDIAIYGKFDNPLLGLIGAHSHFLGRKRKEKLEAQVLHNLWRLMPGSADVIALLLMALDRDEGGLPGSIAELDEAARAAFGQGIGEYLPLTFPPMLSSALQALMRATDALPDLIGEGSWLETAGNSSFGSGVWAVWDQPAAPDTDVSSPRLRESAQQPRPSPQVLFNAVKDAIVSVSDMEKTQISAQSRLDELLINSERGGVGRLLETVIGRAADYNLNLRPEALFGAVTVGDVVTAMLRVEPFALEAIAPPSVSKLGPAPEIEDWLIDYVHDEIEADRFDAGGIARRLAVSRHSVERAAELPRPAGD